MADTTNISWTDHTFNPWWGCTKVSPGCDNCYAEKLDKRTGGDFWNVNLAPRITSNDNWIKPLRWNLQAVESGIRHKVFCGSMMDWCDNKVSPDVRDRLFGLIRRTPMLDWQLLTKRETLIKKCLPKDWDQGYENVWLGVSVENKKHGIPRIERLRDIPAKVKFLSIEPLLENISSPCGFIDLEGIDWVIVGGESGPGYRPMNPEWVTPIINNCHSQNVPLWFKQWGGTKKDKGGCRIIGREIKQFPRTKEMACA